MRLFSLQGHVALLFAAAALVMATTGCGDDSSGGNGNENQNDLDASVQQDGDIEVDGQVSQDGDVEADGDVDGGPTGPYEQEMLSGQWWIHNLSVGAWKGWNYVYAAVDDTGEITSMEYWDSDAGNESVVDPGFNLTITSDGVVTADFDQDVAGFLSQDGQTLVITGDDADGDDRHLDVGLLEGAGGYVQSQLGKVWRVSILSVGDPNVLDSWTGWIRGTATLDDSGVMTDVDLEDSDGNLITTPIQGFMLMLEADGTVLSTMTAAYHGFMLESGDLLVATDTSPDGSFELHVYQETPNTTFDISDLEGEWYYSSLAAGDWEGWTRGTMTVDSTGEITSADLIDSDGDTMQTPPPGVDLELSSDGVLTNALDGSWRGFMSGDKDLIVITLTGTPGPDYEMAVLLRMP
jgi:hypothetical protein